MAGGRGGRGEKKKENIKKKKKILKQVFAKYDVRYSSIKRKSYQNCDHRSADAEWQPPHSVFP